MADFIYYHTKKFQKQALCAGGGALDWAAEVNGCMFMLGSITGLAQLHDMKHISSLQSVYVPVYNPLILIFYCTATTNEYTEKFIKLLVSCAC